MQGRHAAVPRLSITRFSSARHPWLTGGVVALVAAIVAATVAVNSSGQVSTKVTASPAAPRLTANDVRALDHLTTAEKDGIAEAMARSYSTVARTGTGHLALTRVALTSYAFTKGRTGDEFWVIASYADMLDGVFTKAIDTAEAVCVTTTTAYIGATIVGSDGLDAAAALALIALMKYDCVRIGTDLEKEADGWGWSNSHGVWAALYIWKPRLVISRW